MASKRYLVRMADGRYIHEVKVAVGFEIILKHGLVCGLLLSSPPLCTHLRQKEDFEWEMKMTFVSIIIISAFLSASQFGSSG